MNAPRIFVSFLGSRRGHVGVDGDLFKCFNDQETCEKMQNAEQKAEERRKKIFFVRTTIKGEFSRSNVF